MAGNSHAGNTIDGAKLLEQARERLPQAIALRRRIHSEPEIGLDLPKTTAAVLESLDGLDLDIEMSRSTSGVVATLRGARPGRTLLLRADMDALPMQEDTGLEFASKNAGAMHACGHDAHTAMLAQAAHVLASRRSELAGEVRFMFQPGEEGAFGARFMRDEGILEGVDAVFAIHVDPRVPPGMIATKPGPLMASADTLDVELIGSGGHASMPHDAVDPMPVACELVTALQTFVTRRIDAFRPVVLTITQIRSGTTYNVIPENVRMKGTLRSVSEKSRRVAHDGIRRVCEGIASAHDVRAELKITEGYPVTVNDAGFVDFTASASRDLLGERALLEMPSPVMGAEDFSYLLEERPGAMVFLGVRPEGVDRPAPCHSNHMVINESAMQSGIALHSKIALEYLAG